MDVFNLQSSIELDLREFERRLDQAEDDMKKFSKSSSGTFSKIGGLLKDGIVAGAKTAAAGITALATAVTGLAVSASKSYSTFEQLQGGAQKIFDEMDYSKIAKDAENAYKDLNMSANQYLESINLVGAMFAQTMGDEKAYDTARTGMIAISDYASGTGKSIEELNQKYQMITRSTSSYQSIADQFAGILPATSADFLAQAQAAGLLSGEYEKLTEVPIAEYQQALTSMLEKGVSDLGLSQNTLRESTETMTGSIAMAKAAWENLKVAMAGGGDMSTSMEAFSKAVGATIKNVLPVFKNAVKGVGTLIKELTPTIAKEAPALLVELFETIVPAVAEAMPIISQGLVDALPDVIDAINSAWNTLYPSMVESAKIIVPAIVDGILTLLPEFLKLGADIILELINGFSTSLPTLIPQIVDTALKIVTILTSPEVLGALIQAGALLLTELTYGLLNALPTLLEQLPLIVNQIMTVLSDNAPLLLDAAYEMILAVAEGLVENFDLIVESAAGLIAEFGMGIENFVGSLWEKGESIVSEIGEGVKFAIDAAKTWAKDLIDNFVQGIKDNIYKIKEKAAEMAQTVKDYIGFSEPEKGPLSNFHTYAPDMIDLYTQGIDSNQHRLIDSMRGMAANVRNSLNFGGEFTPALASGFGAPQISGSVGGGISQVNYITLSIEGNNTIEDIDTITDRAVEQIAYKLRMLEIGNKRALGGTGW